MKRSLKSLFVAAVLLAVSTPSFAQLQVAAINPSASTSQTPLELMNGKKYSGFFGMSKSSMGVLLVVNQVTGKEGTGRITFYPNDKRFLTCRGEHDATLLLQDDGSVRVRFYRPICDDEAGVRKDHSYVLAVKSGGTEVVTNGGGTLTAN